MLMKKRWFKYAWATSHTWIFPTKKKSEVFSHFQKLKIQVEKETGRHIQCLRSDGGKEYFSDEFISYLLILEIARAMVHGKHMLNFYWAEATSTTLYLMN